MSGPGGKDFALLRLEAEQLCAALRQRIQQRIVDRDHVDVDDAPAVPGIQPELAVVAESADGRRVVIAAGIGFVIGQRKECVEKRAGCFPVKSGAQEGAAAELFIEDAIFVRIAVIGKIKAQTLHGRVPADAPDQDRRIGAERGIALKAKQAQPVLRRKLDPFVGRSQQSEAMLLTITGIEALDEFRERE